MKTLNILFLISFVFIFTHYSILNGYGQIHPSIDPAYKLAWADSFNTVLLDTSKWNKTYPWHQGLNYFICDTNIGAVPMAAIKNSVTDTTNCKVNGETIKLITRKENYSGQCWSWPACPNIPDPCNVPNNECKDGYCWHWDTLPFNFTTAMLYSRWDFRFGYFEIKFKLPPLPEAPKTLKGHGGSFWLWSGGNSFYNEIDGFEINAYEESSNTFYKATGNSHFSANSGSPNSDFFSYSNFTPDTWHTVGINWTSNSIEYYYDSVLQYVSYNHPDSLGQMAIIITCGGSYVPVDNYCVPFDTISADSTHFPYIFEIDYVKVWQHKEDCDNNITLTNYNPAFYPNKLHKSVTMGTNVSITNQTNKSIWASDYILMNETTEIDSNSEFLFNTTNCEDIVLERNLNRRFPFPMPQTFLHKLTFHY